MAVIFFTTISDSPRGTIDLAKDWRRGVIKRVRRYVHINVSPHNLDKIVVDTHNVYFLSVYFLQQVGVGYSGHLEIQISLEGNETNKKECFFTILLITCVSRVIIKMKVKKMGTGIYFLSQSRFLALDSRTCAGVNLFVITKVRIPAVFATKSTCMLQWDRRRYHLPGEKRRMKDFPEQRHIIEKGRNESSERLSQRLKHVLRFLTPWNFETPRTRLMILHLSSILSFPFALKGSRKLVLMIEGRLIFNCSYAITQEWLERARIDPACESSRSCRSLLAMERK